MAHRATIVSDVLLVFIAGVVTLFSAQFAILIWSALDQANGAGLTGMFTSYGYITIEVTFLCLILIGAFYVFRVGLRRGGGDDDWESFDPEG
jgi:hypothetical protein